MTVRIVATLAGHVFPWPQRPRWVPSAGPRRGSLGGRRGAPSPAPTGRRSGRRRPGAGAPCPASGWGVSTACCAPDRMSLRFSTEPTGPPPAWKALERAVEHAVAAVAWAGVQRHLDSHHWSWHTSPTDATQHGWAAARHHLGTVEAACDASAQILLSQLVAVTVPRHQRGHDPRRVAGALATRPITRRLG